MQMQMTLDRTMAEAPGTGETNYVDMWKRVVIERHNGRRS